MFISLAWLKNDVMCVYIFEKVVMVIKFKKKMIVTMLWVVDSGSVTILRRSLLFLKHPDIFFSFSRSALILEKCGCRSIVIIMQIVACLYVLTMLMKQVSHCEGVVKQNIKLYFFLLFCFICRSHIFLYLSNHKN
jgi:hypothetical protein